MFNFRWTINSSSKIFLYGYLLRFQSEINLFLMLTWLQVLARNFSHNQFHTFNYILELIYTRSYLRTSLIYVIYHMHFVILFSNTSKNERNDERYDHVKKTLELSIK